MPRAITEMGSPIFKYEFVNSVDLIAAINRIGPEGLCEILIPHHGSLASRSFGQFLTPVRQLLVETLSPLFGDHLRMDDLYRSVFSTMATRGDELGSDNPVVVQQVTRLVAFVAADIFMLDRQSKEATDQINRGRVDMDDIRLSHHKTLALDPAFLADNFLRRITGYHGHPSRPEGVEERVEELAYLSLGRIALKECRRNIAWCLEQDPTHVRHVIDWIVSAVANNAKWLSNLDDQGRPKKLMKFGSLEAMFAEADKAMRRALSKERASLGEGDESVFADDGGDYRIVRLKTPRALDTESGEMRHCVGQGGYDHRLADRDYLLLSLRDRRNYPHATIEVRANRIIQFRGKANHEPKAEYRDAAVRLLDPHGIGFRKVELLGNPCLEIDAGDMRPWQRAYDGMEVMAAPFVDAVDQNQVIRLFL